MIYPGDLVHVSDPAFDSGQEGMLLATVEEVNEKTVTLISLREVSKHHSRWIAGAATCEMKYVFELSAFEKTLFKYYQNK